MDAWLVKSKTLPRNSLHDSMNEPFRKVGRNKRGKGLFGFT